MMRVRSIHQHSWMCTVSLGESNALHDSAIFELTLSAYPLDAATADDVIVGNSP